MSICYGIPTRHRSSDLPQAQVACTNLFARPAAPQVPGWPESVSMSFDQHDHIVRVSETWDHFADRASMHDLKGRAIMGRPMGRFISDATVRDAFRAMFQNIRRTGQPAHISARCDVPDGPARAMSLDFVAHPDGAIRATWRFVHGRSAHLVPIRRRARFAQGELIRACGWCWRIRVDTGWHRIDHLAVELGLLDRTSLPLVTHGICPRCSAALRAECLHACAG